MNRYWPAWKVLLLFARITSITLVKYHWWSSHQYFCWCGWCVVMTFCYCAWTHIAHTRLFSPYMCLSAGLRAREGSSHHVVASGMPPACARSVEALLLVPPPIAKHVKVVLSDTGVFRAGEATANCSVAGNPTTERSSLQTPPLHC